MQEFEKNCQILSENSFVCKINFGNVTSNDIATHSTCDYNHLFIRAVHLSALREWLYKRDHIQKIIEKYNKLQNNFDYTCD